MTPGPMALNFSEATSHEIFAQRLPQSKDVSLPQVLAAAVTYLHALIRTLRPSQPARREVIVFLADVGHANDERRQERVLLSDQLGASALVEDINSRPPKTATPKTVRGPFFHAVIAHLALGHKISLDSTGEKQEISGGNLLRQACHPMRGPAHLHFMIKAPGFETITTHIDDGSDPYRGEDATFGVKPEGVRIFRRQDKGALVWRLDLTFVMVRSRPRAKS